MADAHPLAGAPASPGDPQPDAERRPTWPGGKSFAFTIFDDTDLTTLVNGPPVYRFITDLGLRVTKSVWPLAPSGSGFVGGTTCADPAYLSWVRSLQADGHEIGYHNATDETSTRERTIEALDRFREMFGHDPACGANHSGNAEAIYWGPARLSGLRSRLYDVVTERRYRGSFHGEDETSPYFWGDLCRDRVRYWRSFTFDGIDTLAAWPLVPYHDPSKPYVQRWFTSTAASNSDKLTDLLTPATLDRLEADGGLCILYTHLGSGYWWQDALHEGVVRVLGDLARRNGWFAPVGEVLDHLAANGHDTVLSDRQRARLERRWLAQKLRSRSTT